jgi:hypothetical protein
MPQERVGQVRGGSDSLDAAVGLGDHLTKGRAGEVGELDGLEAGPQPLDRVEVGRVRRQPLDHQSGSLDAQPGQHRAAAVGDPGRVWPCST